MLVVTDGGWEPHYGLRGINGPIDDLLFPINHGVLFYPGYEVLPSFVAYRADRTDEPGSQGLAEGLRERMRTLFTAPPIPCRRQLPDSIAGTAGAGGTLAKKRLCRSH